MKPSHDAVIVGQGTAGTTLAWHLLWRGWRVLVLDPNEPVTSSKIAAGLITPITGKRIALSWRVDELLPAAREFYRRVESLTGTTFFFDQSAVRLFLTDDERNRWEQKQDLPEIRRHLLAPQPNPLVNSAWFDASGGGFSMATARLDVAAYLEASRRYFVAQHFLVTTSLAWEREVILTKEGAEIPRLGVSARRLISCEGFAAASNPFFRWIPFKAAKGEILSLRIPQCTETRSLHVGVWLAPLGNGDFRAGSTYDWDHLDQQPTAAGRNEILTKLSTFVKQPVEVTGHRAAVRPIIRESKALLGQHPAHPTLGFFNGLGSKGSLHAPGFARQFAAFLDGAGDIDADLDVQKNN
ncbi:MAG: FAD-binding oxidoreductase [Verrucomicrobiales bacterium]|nr:FAD-binding oxidoreductase [Verrucomicrobiales bacterium]